MHPPICDKTAPPHLENPGSATVSDVLKKEGDTEGLGGVPRVMHVIDLNTSQHPSFRGTVLKEGGQFFQEGCQGQAVEGGYPGWKGLRRDC